MKITTLAPDASGLVEWPTHTMQIVFMKLCDCAEPDGTSVYPSVATIARETSLTESAVRAQLAALKDLGLVLNVQVE